MLCPQWLVECDRPAASTLAHLIPQCASPSLLVVVGAQAATRQGHLAGGPRPRGRNNRSYMSKLEKGASYLGLELIAKFATAREVEPAELLRVPARKGAGARDVADDLV
jgi:hypothetical protein